MRNRQPDLRRMAMALLAALLAACSSASVVEPPQTPSPRLEQTTGPATPSAAPTASATLPAATVRPGPTYPPSTTGYGPDPLFPRAEAVDVEDIDATEADEALAIARRSIETAASHQFWLSVAGSGPASEGLEPGEPLILSGVRTTQAGPSSAAWSVTSPSGFPRRTIRYVVIGETVWCDSGVGRWTVFEGVDAELAREDAATLRPAEFFASTFLDRSIGVIPSGRDRLGTSVATRFEATDLRDVPLPGWWFGLDGEIESFALWVSDDGRPLQAEIAGRVGGEGGAGSFRMLLQVARIDDPANRVEPPI